VRILHAVRRYDPLVGGTERYTGDLARAQAAAGHHVTVVTLDRDVTGIRNGRLRPRSRELDVDIVRLPGFGTKRFGITLRPDRLVRLVQAADAVHLHDLRFHLLLITAATALERRPLYLHTHGLIFHTDAWLRLKRLAFRFYYAPILRATRTTVLASSQTDLDQLRRLAPGLAASAMLLPNGVELGEFLSVKSEPELGRIVAIGRVTRSKGLERLLRTLALIRDRDWTVHIHGPGESEESARLQTIAAELGIAGRVHQHGAFEPGGEPELYRKAALAAFPSHAEGFGIALLDAIAVGVPILASDIPPHRQLLGDNSPYLVDWRDPHEVARRASRLLALTANERVAASRDLRMLAEPYRIDRVVKRIDQMYAEAKA